jgi:formylglycine-generating enzyme required for sulfatase activity
MACIPGGPFLRGTNDGPEHARPQAEVWVSTFYMDRNEVTVEAWEACVAAKRCPKEGPQYVDFDRPRQPINGITWFGAKAFCEAQGKRLPTEAEWEKAARGADGRTYPWGEDPVTCERAVFKDPKLGRGCGLKKAGKDPDVGRPDLVGSRPANPYGLHDMAGNSWEWVADWWSKSYEDCGAACQGVDPRGPCGGAETCTSTRQKIVRGGSWFWDAEHMTTFRRRAHFPSNEPFHHFGFRCAASMEGGSAAPGPAAGEPVPER